jgi:hypothetical protein
MCNGSVVANKMHEDRLGKSGGGDEAVVAKRLWNVRNKSLAAI